MATKLDKCLEKIPSRFALATVATKRWEQILHGSYPMVESSKPRALETVLKEIETGNLAFDVKERRIEKLGVPIPPPPEPVVTPADPAIDAPLDAA
jgi:DNA-directed RNA polymerase omega subunit